MIYQKLSEFFKLEGNQELVDVATKPKSCGGGKEFKKLALQGDYIINQALLQMHPAIKDVGTQTKLKTDFHNRRTLVRLGEKLGIDEAIGQHKLGHIPSENEIKEAVESLLGASHEINELEVVLEIVKELYLVAKEMGYLDINYKGMLNEHFQKIQEELPDYKCKRSGGSDHKPLWQCTVNCSIRGEPLTITSDLFPIKKDAERNAAFKMMNKLGLETEQEFNVEAYEEIVTLQSASQSITAKNINFTKTADMFEEGEFPVTRGKDELISKWAEKRAKNDSYYLLVQLSTLYQEVSGSTWIAEMNDGGILVLLHLQINNKEFFEIGQGVSKTKARKAAALKIIEASNLYEWLEENEQSQ